MRQTLLFLGLALLAPASGCTARELAWLLPRASVGVAIRTHEGHLGAAGFVTLSSPLERPAGRRRPAAEPSGRLRLASASAPCSVAEACRWEARARAGTLVELAEDEWPDGRAP